MLVNYRQIIPGTIICVITCPHSSPMMAGKGHPLKMGKRNEGTSSLLKHGRSKGSWPFLPIQEQHHVAGCPGNTWSDAVRGGANFHPLRLGWTVISHTRRKPEVNSVVGSHTKCWIKDSLVQSGSSQDLGASLNLLVIAYVCIYKHIYTCSYVFICNHRQTWLYLTISEQDSQLR